ncbi:hypothetical protein L2E82_37908 [Cichorium intybus]|uniref:Uncharacterized protein n=1 Tax=Cichorium intybus TaxID=13427 RepID=A0ACB9AFI4_CICIN|nr:hypothetical protein L2E82_37908 [Cichorium intybus]
MDGNLGTSLAVHRLCVETKVMGIIAEEMTVMIDNHVFVLRIREAVGLWPTFVKEEDDVSLEDEPFLDANDFKEEEEDDLFHSEYLQDEGEEKASTSDPFHVRQLIEEETRNVHASRKKEDNGGTVVIIDKAKLGDINISLEGNNMVDRDVSSAPVRTAGFECSSNSSDDPSHPPEVCSKFKKAKGMRSLFSILRPVLNGFHIKERIVWMEVSGLPCCAWNDVAVTKVVAQGIEYEVVVKELSNWEPEIFVEEECNQQEIPSMVEESEDDKSLLGSNYGNRSEGAQEQEKDDLEEGEMRFEYQHQQNHATHGAGFVDRSGKFCDTSAIKRGRFTVNNENNKFVKTNRGSKVRTVEDDEENDGERREAENDNHGEKDFVKVDENGDEVIKKGPSLVDARLEKEVGSRGSKVDSLLYRGRRSNSLGSIKSNMKRVPTDVDNINDVMAQYMEMGKMLGYDMESNKQKVEKMLGRSGAFKVVQ